MRFLPIQRKQIEQSKSEVNKLEARELAKKNLSLLDTFELEALSVKISKNIELVLLNIITQENLHENSVIGGFCPIQKEPLWYLSSEFQRMTLAVPSVEENFSMSFYHAEYDEIGSRSLGLKLDEEKRRKRVIPTILLVPALAFDDKCHRLGRGAGYYDRYLSAFEGIKIGVGFEVQVLKNIPIDEHDIDCDLLITEKNIYKKGK